MHSTELEKQESLAGEETQGSNTAMIQIQEMELVAATRDVPL